MNRVCPDCIFQKPSALSVLMPGSATIHARCAEMVDGVGNYEDQINTMISFLTLSVFGGPDANVSAGTCYTIEQCLLAIWNLGNRNISCKDHHIAELYEASGKGVFCLRKYMMETSIDFLKKLWEESQQNEEQFQALVRDRWAVHQMSFIT